MGKRIGEILVKNGIITKEQLEKALEEQRNTGEKLGQVLVRLGYLKEYEIKNFLSTQFNVPAVDLGNVEIEDEAVKSVPPEIVQKYQMIPIRKRNSTIVIAMSDPSNIFAIDDVKFLTGCNVEVVIASESDIKAAIDKYYDSLATFEEVISDIKKEEVEYVSEEEEVSVTEIEKLSEEAPVVKLVNVILIDAIKKGASDIHIEPYEKTLRVRYRIDGILYEVMKPPMKLKNAIISRIKIMSKLDIAERRLPQDGRIKLKISGGKSMDFRVSVLPVLYGEKVVIRLLDTSNLQIDMTKLGFEEKALKDFKEAIYKPYGMVLVTGPTGSGKTTTLYSALQELNRPDVNISTAEDPVEFNIYGINQVQIHEDIGLTFAAALRSFLRQDPDVIMVGEIRDLETAEIAVKAALTGHLVLSTLHTNDAPSTINRLLNMGVEPFLIASSLNLILAQRLARRICSECKEEIKLDPKVLIDAGMSEEDVESMRSGDGVVCYKGKGCQHCSGTGYKGRVALYEVMPVSDEIKELILKGANSSEIKREAVRLGMKTLRQSGLTKVKEGVTTLQEVLRVTVKD